MPILAVINEKGGVGKTTITTNLGRALQKAGKDVLLVDADPQGSLRDWYAAAGEEHDLPSVVAMDRPALFKDLPRLAQAHDWTLIDGAPSVEELAVAAIKAADAVLIPVQPSPYDIWAAESLVSLVKTRQELAGRPAARFLISRQIVGTKLSQEIRDVLVGYELPVMSAYTCQRVVYATSAAQGSSVLDAEPQGAAASEVQGMLKEVVAWLS